MENKFKVGDRVVLSRDIYFMDANYPGGENDEYEQDIDIQLNKGTKGVITAVGDNEYDVDMMKAEDGGFYYRPIGVCVMENEIELDLSYLRNNKLKEIGI